MDSQEFLYNLMQNVNKIPGKKSVSQCLARCTGRPCQVKLASGEVLSGDLEKAGPGSDFTLKHHWRNTNFKFGNIISMTCKAKPQNLKTDSEISSNKKSRRNLQRLALKVLI